MTLGLTLGVLSVAMAGHGLAAGRTEAAAPQALTAPCIFTSTRLAEPLRVVEAGHDLTLTLGLEAKCDAAARPLHIVFVVDRAEDMLKDDWEGLRNALATALRGLNYATLPGLRFGVVRATNNLMVGQYLTQAPEQIIAAINDIPQTVGTSCLECGLTNALRMLDNAPLPPNGAPPRRVILILSGGSGINLDGSACEVATQKAIEIKARGDILLTAAWSCAGTGCGGQCLRDAANGPVAPYWGWRFLYESFIPEMVYATGAFHPVASVHIVDELADIFRYRDGGDPDSNSGNRLEWTSQASTWPTGGISYTYFARNIYCGMSRVSKVMTATVRYDPLLWSGVPDRTILFRERFFECQHPTSTPDGDQPTEPPPLIPTPTPPETPIPTPVLSPTPDEPPPTATPSPRPGRLFLPWTGQWGCTGMPDHPQDVVLAINVSGSMSAPAGIFGSRWELARSVAAAMLGTGEPSDQFGILAYFAPDPRRPLDPPYEWLIPLSADQAALGKALGRLPKRGGSRLDLAMASALGELTGSRARPGAQPILVLLSDGDLNQATPRDVLERTIALRAAGVTVVVIAIGDPAAIPMWEALTGDPARVFVADPALGLDWPRLLGGVVRCGR